MEVNKISLPVVYKIETVRSKGVSNQELLAKLESGDVSSWSDYNSNFDFSELVELYQKDPEQFKSMIEIGYAVKFVTLPGIKNILKLKFGLLEEQDYESTETGITGLQVNDEQYAAIKQMLSKNWKIEELAGTGVQKVLKIEL
ncbi:hypothetical protein [Bacillus benzoevorans]|uniref:Uncharacterized protein n=1 Tax=Bacillus benzoevorans TaxID=1456 RepID=A0A7X0HR74_9BACI|nr:hypothetical protein [Bacillus benzoevorans]MBB6444051.1 hypothetical protein [Bacillus benzoevorans]